jgi:hypothetical protein
MYRPSTFFPRVLGGFGSKFANSTNVIFIINFFQKLNMGIKEKCIAIGADWYKLANPNKVVKEISSFSTYCR